MVACVHVRALFFVCTSLSIVSPKSKKLARVGESFIGPHSELVPAQWQVNKEEEARRQLHFVSCMFHFRHWDDYASKGIRTSWGVNSSDALQEQIQGLPSCMVLYLDARDMMVFETCDELLLRPEQMQKKQKNLRRGGPQTK